ncbi:MAG: hotdog fold thioesterase [Gammaproteobacteria bacterium]|nr:hotdog fold thioesterase [Gammaproteobacteria bacterium]
MSQRDRFARMLGIEVEMVSPGYCRASLRVTEQMLNAVGLTHGGVTFSLADFAFAVASNSHGRVAVALTAQISYPEASRLGDKLIAEARESHKTGRTGHYGIEVRTAGQQLVGLFSGTVFRRTDKLTDWMNGERS